MTNGSATAEWRSCPRCSALVHMGDHFCPGCRANLAPSPPLPLPRGDGATGPVRPRPVDGTTRYLCAAAQLDPEFADQAIAEYLVEDVRAVPPSLGVDAAAVLREAVAARARCRIRDAVLLVLLLAFALATPSTFVLWLIVAVVVHVSTRYATTGGWQRTIALVVVGLIVVAAGLTGLVNLSVLLLLLLGNHGVGSSLLGGTMIATALAVLLALAILTVLLVDACTVHWLTRVRFRAGFEPDSRRAATNWERTVRGLGRGAFAGPLHRVAAADAGARSGVDSADVVVHRGYSPFVGAGTSYLPTVLALPLEPDGDRKPEPIDVLELHQHIASALVGRRASASLAPDGRLEGLTEREQLLVQSESLVRHHREDPYLLPDLDGPPLAAVPIPLARRLARNPREWVRYYRCFRVESWDRDLASSCYVYAGTDQRMLYLEWTQCVLPPLRESYRAIDYAARFGKGPFALALSAAVRLPASVIGRLRSVVHFFRPLPQRPGEIVPDRYGTRRSLRELAADDDVQSYFQSVDVSRYSKIIERTLFRAVGDFLDRRGYSVVEFQEVASAVITNNVTVNGGTHVGSTIGAGSVVGAGTTRTGSVRGSE